MTSIVAFYEAISVRPDLCYPPLRRFGRGQRGCDFLGYRQYRRRGERRHWQRVQIEEVQQQIDAGHEGSAANHDPGDGPGWISDLPGYIARDVPSGVRVQDEDQRHDKEPKPGVSFRDPHCEVRPTPSAEHEPAED